MKDRPIVRWLMSGMESEQKRNRQKEFICSAPSMPGVWFYKAREGHELASVEIINIVRVDGETVYREGEEERMRWHGLWAGPIEMPKGWNRKHTSEMG